MTNRHARRNYDEHGVLSVEHSDLYEEKAYSYSQHYGYVRVSELFSPELKTKIREELEAAFEAASVRRDILMAQTDASPRKMFNVRYADLHQYCHGIQNLYASASVKKALSRIVGELVFDCPWEHERYIATRLSHTGDTHGWHWDDYAFSLIFIVESPAVEYGGSLEFVCNSRWDKQNPNVEYYVEKFPKVTEHHQSGDVYLFRSDKTLHRVTPVKQGAQRTILNMVFASAMDYVTEAYKDHETMEKLFE